MNPTILYGLSRIDVGTCQINYIMHFKSTTRNYTFQRKGTNYAALQDVWMQNILTNHSPFICSTVPKDALLCIMCMWLSTITAWRQSGINVQIAELIFSRHLFQVSELQVLWWRSEERALESAKALLKVDTWHFAHLKLCVNLASIFVAA